MLEVIYRIYEVADKEKLSEEIKKECSFLGVSTNIELTMDCKICESREHFKELIKGEYGENIAFRNTKKLKAGDLYCIIIGEHCYNTDKYFNRVEYNCAYCGAKVRAFVDGNNTLSNFTIRNDLCGQFDKYSNVKFCSYRCRENFVEREKKKLFDEGYVDESFITRDSFSYADISGYIYKISKKSTGEFYIGQTKYVPIFRWGQHLKTERFDVKNILDYQFEVIEVVPKSENILEREKYYIQKYYKENPEKSLNIACTANIEKLDQLKFTDG